MNMEYNMKQKTSFSTFSTDYDSKQLALWEFSNNYWNISYLSPCPFKHLPIHNKGNRRAYLDLLSV